MSIVPAFRLSSAELSMLGNNIIPPPIKSPRRRRPKPNWVTAAVNRSLKIVGERVTTLHRPTALAS